jgi:hypothetical protein
VDVPGEPLEVRALALEVAAGRPGEGSAIIAGAEVGDGLWEAWAPTLHPAGVGREAFDALVAGYGLELWLWVMGERTWAECAAGLAGRLARRRPVDQPPPTSA